MKTNVKEFTKVDGNTTPYSKNGIKANAWIRAEQDVDLVLENMKLKTLSRPHDEMLIMTDSRYINYKANEDRIFLKDDLLFRKCFGGTSSVKYYQILIPKQLVNEVLSSLHGEFGKHPGIAKTKIAYREIFFRKWRNWSGSGSCHVSNASKNHELTVVSPTPPCKTPMGTLLLPKKTCKSIWCRNYRNLVVLKTLWQPWMCFPAIYLHTRSQIRTPKELLNFQLTTWLRTLTYQRHSSRIKVSRVNKEVAGVLGIVLKHATTKHTQKSGC